MKKEDFEGLVEDCTKQMHQEIITQIDAFLDKNNLTNADFARFTGVTKGYMSQFFNGSPDHKISKIIAMALAIGKLPVISFKDIPSYSHNSEFTDFSITSLPNDDSQPF